MPLLEYRCTLGHVTEKFFKTISEGAEVDVIECPECRKHNQYKHAVKTVSMPLEAMLYGNPDGYHKPAATKRFTTKTVSKIEGNSSAAG